MHDDRAVLIHRETGRRIGPAQRWLAPMLRKRDDAVDEAQQRRADAAIAQLRGGNTTE